MTVANERLNGSEVCLRKNKDNIIADIVVDLEPVNPVTIFNPTGASEETPEVVIVEEIKTGTSVNVEPEDSTELIEEITFNGLKI